MATLVVLLCLILLFAVFFVAYTFEPIPITKGAIGYLINNFIYRKHRNRLGTQFLRCRKHGCNATDRITNGHAYLGPQDHDHPADDIRAIAFKKAVKDAARQPSARRSSLSDIYHTIRNKFVGDLPCNAAVRELEATLPTEKASMVAAHRARVEVLPKNPTKLSEIDSQYLRQNLELPDENGQGNTSFMLFDSGHNDSHRMFVFGNPLKLTRMAFAEQLHLDGTFWVTPKLYSQLLTIHMKIYGQMFPVFYILLDGKSEQLYKTMFQNVFQVLARFGIHQLPYLHTVVSDFETGLMGAVKDSFPGVTHKGCYFHFCQAVYRNVVRLGYKTAYQTDASFHESVRALLALGHVPTGYKLSYYGLVFARFATDQRFVHLAQDYFYKYWMGTFGGAKMTMWDWFKINVRTNNHVEGFHSGLKSHFETPHLQFYRFASAPVDKERKSAQRLRDRINRPNQPLTVDRTYAKLNARILSLHEEFYVRTPLHFILPLAHTAPQPLVIEIDNN